MRVDGFPSFVQGSRGRTSLSSRIEVFLLAVFLTRQLVTRNTCAGSQQKFQAPGDVKREKRDNTHSC
jgi:hypothetical protein